jgi:hypothetical protein
VNTERFHLVLSAHGRPVMHGWWGSEETARRKFTRWIGEHGSADGAHITLTDTATDTVLTTWPDGP